MGDRPLCVFWLLTAWFGLTSGVSATWSVVVTNVRTGEVGVAQATCIVGVDLQPALAVVLPGVGGACVQAWWDFSGDKRRILWDELRAGTDPDDILALIEEPRYQFGIVDTLGRAATFTGDRASSWAGGVIGQAGDLRYAIQGNILAGEEVVRAAERALVETEGDVAQRLMRAMLAAAQFGGDGRCSCSSRDPDGCGSPPPGFALDTGKSAHTGFVLVARVGDRRGPCNDQKGCATGDYFLNLTIAPGQNDLPDPIVEMNDQFRDWRKSWIGRPDHLKSHTQCEQTTIPGDGVAETVLTIQLRDFQETVLASTPTVYVEHDDEASAGLCKIGEVRVDGPGQYSVTLRAGRGQGQDRFRVTADDGQGEVLLYPFPTLNLQ